MLENTHGRQVRLKAPTSQVEVQVYVVFHLRGPGEYYRLIHRVVGNYAVFSVPMA